MTRDYAPGRRQNFPVVGVLSGVAVGAGLALLASVLLTPLPENEQRLVQDRPDPGALEAAPQTQSTGPSVPPKEQARFKFYELLPNFEIIPFSDPTSAPKPAPQSRATPTPRPTTQPAARPNPGEIFFVQAGSFRNKDDAEAQKARLALFGFAARIEPVTIPGKGRFFRLRIGPYDNIGSTRGVMERLAANGVESYFYRESSR